jgi:hypothetical protein
MRWLSFPATTVVIVIALASFFDAAQAGPAPAVAVSPQYDTTHVLVAEEDFDRFADSLIATFGGSKSQKGVIQVTPTPSQTISQLVFMPVGTISVFGFKTPIPYPFGSERTGYLVTDLDVAVKSAKEQGANVVVSTFPDVFGRDAIIEWPGGVHMQLYWHTKAPNYAPLQTVPENRVYVSQQRAERFVRSFVEFSRGKVVSDDSRAPGIEIGRPGETYRRIRIESNFGRIAVLVTDGHLPYPYGRELMGYEVANLSETLNKAAATGVSVLVPRYSGGDREAAILQFPGGYIAEIHTASSH